MFIRRCWLPSAEATLELFPDMMVKPLVASVCQPTMVLMLTVVLATEVLSNTPGASKPRLAKARSVATPHAIQSGIPSPLSSSSNQSYTPSLSLSSAVAGSVPVVWTSRPSLIPSPSESVLVGSVPKTLSSYMSGTPSPSESALMRGQAAKSWPLPSSEGVPAMTAAESEADGDPMRTMRAPLLASTVPLASSSTPSAF